MLRPCSRRTMSNPLRKNKMPVSVPNTRPRLSSQELGEIISPFNLDRDRFPLLIVGIRGYYRKSLGNPESNDRNIYDEAIFIDSPHVSASYNGNTDPSIFRKGTGSGSGKGIARLKAGL